MRLEGKHGLVLGVANKRSIALGIAREVLPRGVGPRPGRRPPARGIRFNAIPDVSIDRGSAGAARPYLLRACRRDAVWP